MSKHPENHVVSSGSTGGFPAALASRQLLRAIRGSRSQAAFSRRLGYLGNPAADWEAGRRFPTAQVMLRAGQRSHIDVRGALEAFHQPSAARLGDPLAADVASWLDALRGGTPILRLAARSGFSRFAVGRWLSGQASPRVPEWLALVEAITGRASDLVAALVSIANVPSMEPSYRARQRARRLAFEQPWTEALLRMLELRAYAFDAEPGPQALARALEVPTPVVRRALEAMLEARVIRVADGVLQGVAPLHVDTRGERAGFVELRRHWAEVAMRRVTQDREEDWFAYNVMSLSNEERERAREILRNAYREVRSLAAQSEHPECALLLNIQLLSWQ